jgi:hypothetical protein
MTEMEYILQNPDLYAWVIKEFPIGCEITIQYVKPVVCVVIGYEVRDGQLVLNTQGEHGGPSVYIYAERIACTFSETIVVKKPNQENITNA